MDRFVKAAMIVALVLGLAYVALPANLKAKFRSGAVNSPEPTKQEAPAPEPTEQAAPGPAPTLPFSTCIDGSKVTILSYDDNQINYRCESGTTGWYLRPKK